MLRFLKEYSYHIEKAFSIAPKIKLKEINKIVVGGMGGSAISGDILRDYLEDEIEIPIFVVRKYKLPKFVDKNTLVFMISYSGNTEESLSMLEHARKKKCQIILVTSGGKFSRKRGLPIINIPKGHVPRVALPYLFFPILKVLQDNKIIKNKEKDVREISKLLKSFDLDMARNLSKKFFRRTPVFYGPENYRGVLYRWQTQFNENSKKFAHYNCFTEMNHNEIVSDFKDNKDVFALIINDEKINKRIKRQMALGKKILSKEIEVNEIKIKGRSFLSRIFYAIYLGDCLSFYLSIFRAVKTEETRNIDFIKKGLKCTK